MLEKLLKIGGLCLLGLGGVIMLIIPGIGLVTGPAAITMAAIGAGAVVGTAWGGSAYHQHNQNVAMENELKQLQQDIAMLEAQAETIQYRTRVVTQKLQSTAVLKAGLEGLVNHDATLIEAKDRQCDTLQRALQEKTREISLLKMRLEYGDMNDQALNTLNRGDDDSGVSPLLTERTMHFKKQ